MPIWEWTQIALGILIFPLILVHIVGTQGAGHIIGFQPTYEYVVFAIWVSDPMLGFQQSVMMMIVWSHMCMGLHYWLRLKAWYARWSPVLLGCAVVLPVTAFLGFARVGRELNQSHAHSSEIQERVFAPFRKAEPEVLANLYTLENNFYAIFVVLVMSVLIARFVRRLYRNRHGVYQLSIFNGRTLTAPVGQTILETLRIADLAFDVNLLFSLRRAGHTVKEVPIEWTDQLGSKVTSNLWRLSLVMFLSVVRLRLVHSPFYNWLRPLRPLETWLYLKLNAPPPRPSQNADSTK